MTKITDLPKLGTDSDMVYEPLSLFIIRSYMDS